MEFVHVTYEQRHMNTDFRLTVACPRTRIAAAETALLACLKRIGELEEALSEFCGPVKKLNESSPGEFIELPEPTLRCLCESLRVKSLSAGAFDPLAKSTGAHPGLKLQGKLAARETAGTKLSFAAIGKGFALDEVALLLERDGFSDYLLEAGGSSLVISGRPSPDEDWVFGWSWARDKAGDYLGRKFRHASGDRVALGISGTLEQGSHILDPRNGKTASGARSALVAGSSAARADALSTALFVNGWDEKESGAAAFVGDDQLVRWSPEFQKYWGPVC